MKMVVAIIKSFKLDEVREALSAIGVQGIPSPKSTMKKLFALFAPMLLCGISHGERAYSL